MTTNTITSRTATLLIWADIARRQSPELNWAKFDQTIEELRQSVPGCGPMKSESGYYRALSLFQILSGYLETYSGDLCPATINYVVDAGIRELEQAIQI